MRELTIELTAAFTRTPHAFVQLNNDPVSLNLFTENRYTTTVDSPVVKLTAGVGNRKGEKVISLTKAQTVVTVDHNRFERFYKAILIVFILFFIAAIVLKAKGAVPFSTTPFLTLLPVYIILAARARKPVITQQP